MSRGRSSAWRFGWTAAALIATLAVAALPGLRAPVLGAFAELNFRAVLATLPGQVASVLLCAAALWILNPRPRFRAAVGSRLLRDAAGNLVVIAPGLGELAGARALMLAGGAMLSAVTVSALDVLAETLAQIPFAAGGIVVVARRWPAPSRGRIWMAIGALLLLLGLLSAAVLWGPRLAPRCRDAIADVLAKLKANVRAAPRPLAAAVALHGCAWAMGGVQVWCVAAALGGAISLKAAILLESFVYAARACAFALPGGLGVQEAAFVAAGLAFGMTPPEALAISLALRCRDLLFGAPALAVWPILELRAARARARAH